MKSDEKLCTSCLTVIPSAAAVCKQCRNFQGAWWFWRLVGLGLPWLVAGFTVVSYFSANLFRSTLEPLDRMTTIVEQISTDRMSLLFVNGNTSPMIFKSFSSITCDLSGKKLYDVKNVFLISGDPVVPALSSRILTFNISKSEAAKLATTKQQDSCSFYFDERIGQQDFGERIIITPDDLQRIRTGMVEHSGF